MEKKIDILFVYFFLYIHFFLAYIRTITEESNLVWKREQTPPSSCTFSSFSPFMFWVSLPLELFQQVPFSVLLFILDFPCFPFFKVVCNIIGPRNRCLSQSEQNNTNKKRSLNIQQHTHHKVRFVSKTSTFLKHCKLVARRSLGSENTIVER